MAEDMEKRVAELERQVVSLQKRSATCERRPASWPKLDANSKPFVKRFAGE